MSKFKFFNGLINSLFDKPIKTKTFNFFSDNFVPTKKILGHSHGQISRYLGGEGDLAHVLKRN